MASWVGSGHITKTRINFDLIEIIQFCLKIYDLRRNPTYGWVSWVIRWMGGLMDGVMSNLIKIE